MSKRIKFYILIILSCSFLIGGCSTNIPPSTLKEAQDVCEDHGGDKSAYQTINIKKEMTMKENEILQKITRTHTVTQYMGTTTNTVGKPVKVFLKFEQPATLGYFSAFTSGEDVLLGMSYIGCSYNKHYTVSKKDLRSEARNDALDEPKQLFIPQSFKKDFLKFYDRCLNRKSFQGKNIIDSVYYYVEESGNYMLIPIDYLRLPHTEMIEKLELIQ